MLHLIKYIAILILLVSLAYTGFAQNFRAEMARVNGAFDSLTNIGMKVTYRLYNDYTTDKINSTEVSELKKQGTNLYLKLEDVETIYTEKFDLVVDRENKSIIISDPSPERNKLTGLKKSKKPEENYKEIEPLVFDNGLKGYRVNLEEVEQEQYNKMQIEFNPKTWMLTRLVLYYKDDIDVDNTENPTKPRMEIMYSDPQPVTSDISGLFKLENYILQNKNGLIATKAYQGYEVIDNRKKLKNKS